MCVADLAEPSSSLLHDFVIYLISSRLERSDLFESLAGLVSRTAFPLAKGPDLGPLHLVCLDALLAILTAIAAE